MPEDLPDAAGSPSEAAAPLDEAAERFLLQLLDTPAPSGHEDAAAALWQARARELGADVREDRIGTSLATFVEQDAARPLPRIALVGHLDEIGLAVARINEKGFVKVVSIGGWDSVVLPGQRLRIIGTPAGGPVLGTVSRGAVHVLDAAARAKAPSIPDLWVDLGVDSRAAALELVAIGDPAVIDVAPQRIGGPGSTRLCSRSIDNRIGAFVALEAAYLATSRGARCETVAVGSVGEEIGMGGSMAAAAGLEPGRTCVIDVTAPGDIPGGSDIGDLKLGGGPILTRGSSLSERIVAELVSAADAAGLSYQLRAKGLRTATDADQTIKAGRGMATCLVSIPARYLHTPVEQVDLADVRTSIEVIAAWIIQTGAQHA